MSFLGEHVNEEKKTEKRTPYKFELFKPNKNQNIKIYNQSAYILFYFFDLCFRLNSQLPADLPPPPLIL